MESRTHGIRHLILLPIVGVFLYNSQLRGRQRGADSGKGEWVQQKESDYFEDGRDIGEA